MSHQNKRLNQNVNDDELLDLLNTDQTSNISYEPESIVNTVDDFIRVFEIQQGTTEISSKNLYDFYKRITHDIPVSFIDFCRHFKINGIRYNKSRFFIDADKTKLKKEDYTKTLPNFKIRTKSLERVHMSCIQMNLTPGNNKFIPEDLAILIYKIRNGYSISKQNRTNISRTIATYFLINFKNRKNINNISMIGISDDFIIKDEEYETYKIWKKTSKEKSKI